MVCPDSTFLPKLNPIEPPWYGPVCPVVGEGWRREVSPYPDQSAAEAIRRIAELYAVEAEIRGLAAEQRHPGRQQKSRPIVKSWLEEQLRRIPGRGSLAEAIRYMLSRWQSLTLFLDDGRVELDTNTIERAIRPIALGRKNALFAGSDGGARSWAIIASLIQTAKLNQVEPFAYLRDI